MPLQPRLARERQVEALPLLGGFQHQKRVVVIDALFQYFPHLGYGMPRAYQPYRAQAMYASAERFYRVVDLLIVLIVMELVRDEINGHSNPPLCKYTDTENEITGIIVVREYKEERCKQRSSTIT